MGLGRRWKFQACGFVMRGVVGRARIARRIGRGGFHHRHSGDYPMSLAGSGE
jgi:hypothetical protein